MPVSSVRLPVPFASNLVFSMDGGGLFALSQAGDLLSVLVPRGEMEKLASPRTVRRASEGAVLAADWLEGRLAAICLVDGELELTHGEAGVAGVRRSGIRCKYTALHLSSFDQMGVVQMFDKRLVSLTRRPGLPSAAVFLLAAYGGSPALSQTQGTPESTRPGPPSKGPPLPPQLKTLSGGTQKSPADPVQELRSSGHGEAELYVLKGSIKGSVPWALEWQGSEGLRFKIDWPAKTAYQAAAAAHGVVVPDDSESVVLSLATHSATKASSRIGVVSADGRVEAKLMSATKPQLGASKDVKSETAVTVQLRAGTTEWLTIATYHEKPIGPLAISPDGTRVALGVGDRVVVLDSRGTELRRFSKKKSSFRIPIFGTAGNVVFFQATTGTPPGSTIFEGDIASGKVRSLAELQRTGDFVDFSVSPDRGMLAYVRRDEGRSILNVRDLESRSEILLSSPSVSDTSPRFSPDGMLLAFIREQNSRGHCIYAVGIADLRERLEGESAKRP